MNWKSIDAPNYCFKLHKRLETTTKVNPSDIIFFEGKINILISIFI